MTHPDIEITPMPFIETIYGLGYDSAAGQPLCGGIVTQLGKAHGGLAVDEQGRLWPIV